MNKLTITEACKLAHVSRPTIYKYINNGTLSIVKDGKNTFIESSELIRVFPESKLNNDNSEVKSLHSLTIEIAHKNEIIDMLKKQLDDKHKENEFLQQQLTQVNSNFTTVNKLLEDKSNKKHKKFFGIF